MYTVDCDIKTDPAARIRCENETMISVTWTTNVTFDATVTEIPTLLKQRLTDRVIKASRHPILGLVIINRQPP